MLPEGSLYFLAFNLSTILVAGLNNSWSQNHVLLQWGYPLEKSAAVTLVS